MGRSIRVRALCSQGNKPGCPWWQCFLAFPKTAVVFLGNGWVKCAGRQPDEDKLIAQQLLRGQVGEHRASSEQEGRRC